MVDFRKLPLDRLLDIKEAHERYEKLNCWDIVKYGYHHNVICAVNSEMFRRYNSVWSK